MVQANAQPKNRAKLFPLSFHSPPRQKCRGFLPATWTQTKLVLPGNPASIAITFPKIPLHMKTPIVPAVIALAAALAGNCLALTPVEDTFSGKKLNETHWYQTSYFKGKLAQEGGKLNFVVTDKKPTAKDYSALELVPSQPGFNESWEVIFDLSNTSNLGKKAGCGIQIFNYDDRGDYLYVEFYGKSGIAAGVLADLHEVPGGRLTTKVAIPKGSIRIHFDAATKLMTFYISATSKAKGYKWNEIGTFSPTGKGGDVRANWKLKPAKGRFGIVLYGFGVSQKVAAGKVTIDNFNLFAAP
jgi:hypothetical protein